MTIPALCDPYFMVRRSAIAVTATQLHDLPLPHYVSTEQLKSAVRRLSLERLIRQVLDKAEPCVRYDWSHSEGQLRYGVVLSYFQKSGVDVDTLVKLSSLL